jgi:hypothetical protein
MNQNITYQQLTARLHEQALPCADAALPGGLRLVMTTLGGRIFAFLPGSDESLFWVNPVFGARDDFASFVAQRAWNIGGDRVWIGPQIQFMLRDGASGGIPPAMDPGDFRLEALDDSTFRLSQEAALEAHTIGNGAVTVRIERTIRPLADPLAGEGISEGLFCGGYEQVIRMAHLGPGPAMASWWSVTNLHPGGDVVFAATPGLRYDDFIAPVPPELHSIGPHYARARLTGEHQYKTGYQAAHILGRFAYLNVSQPGHGYLLVRSFHSRPGGAYLEEPSQHPGRNGASAFVYNDDGRFGRFGEFECMGAAIGGSSGETVCEERLPLWVYRGHPEALAAILRALVGVTL